MIEHEIVLTVPGHPAPKGSLKCIGGRGGKGHVLIEDNKRTKGWRTDLATWARKAQQRGEKGQPIIVEVTSTLARPKSHYGTGKNAGTVKPAFVDAFPVGHQTGDVDKLARLVLDALQDAGLIPDDCAVVEVVSRKAWTEDEGTVPLVPDALPFPGARLRLMPVATPD